MKKQKKNPEKDRNNMGKENNTDESDFSEKKIPDLNHLNALNLNQKRTSEILTVIRSSHQRCFVIKGVLRNFAKFTGKHLCQSLIFNKVAGLSHVILLKKETLTQVFSCKVCEISKNTFFVEFHRTTASEL